LEATTDAPAADAFPLSKGRYRKCAEAWFPEPKEDPVAYFAAAFSFPQWLAERWHHVLSALPVKGSVADLSALPVEGSVADLSPLPVGERVRVRGVGEAPALIPPTLEALGFWFNAPPPLILRVNPLKTTRDAVLERFAEAGIPAEAGELAQAIVLTESRNVTELPGFAEGHFSVQDLSAMKAVELMNPQPGEEIWDFCAAPGPKTAAIAERMHNQGRVLATDTHTARLSRIEENRQRLGLDIIEVESISCVEDDWPTGPFDAVLVDAPCSNTGVLAKRIEARWRLTPTDIAELSCIQFGLLEAACDRVKPGGRVLYSTCSIEREENQAIVEAVLSRRPEWKLIEQQLHWPGQPADGGFAALLRHG
jgi:16S rRNA (cytosine967-C5)-methyltransferase